MADSRFEPISNPLQATLSRIVDEFAWLSDFALQRIAAGGSSGYIRPSLAVALIEARRLTGLAGMPQLADAAD